MAEPIKSIAKQLEGQILVPYEPGLASEARRPDILSFEDYRGQLPQAQQIPNYDQLTSAERRVWDALPGFAESSIGKWLQKLDEGWAGGVLRVLDVGAEALERTTGVFVQGLAAVGSQEGWADFTGDLSTAWYAGSLAAEFANLPRHETIPGTNRRRWTFMEDGPLPGMAGLVVARQKIAALHDQGMEMGEALEQVRREALDDAGALALRMQMNDAYFHMLADPLNIVMLWLKPVDRLKVATSAALRARSVPAYLEAGLRSVDNLAQLGQMTAEEANRARTVLRNVPRLTPFHETVLRMMGEIPVEGPVGKFLAGRLNPFRLSPQARVANLATDLTDNIMAHIASSGDPEDMIRLIGRAADGTYDPRIAHMIVSHEGAMVRGLLQGFDAQAKDLVSAWRVAAPNRNLLNYMARVLGQDQSELLTSLFKTGGLNEVFTELIKKSAGSEDELRVLLKAAGLPNEFDAPRLAAALTPVLGKGMLSTEMFQAELINSVADFATRALVNKFGLKATGFVRKLADTMKAAESLAFLRGNPGYFMRNLLNGEFTMLARGSWRWNTGAGRAFWKALGVEPVRLRTGFGIAGEVPEIAQRTSAAGRAAETIGQVVKEAATGERGWTDRAANWIRNINLGPVDFAKHTGRVEAKQSERAFTSGAMEWWHRWRKAAQMDEELRSVLRASGLSNEDIEHVRKAAASAMNEADLERALLNQDVKLNRRAILDGANARFGKDITDVIPADEAAGMADELALAWKKGGASEVRDSIVRMRAETEARYLREIDNELKDVGEWASQYVQHAGPGGAVELHGSMLDEFYGDAHYQYAKQFGPLYDDLKAGRAAGASWEAARGRAKEYWDAKWGRLRKLHEGIVGGMQADKKTFPHLEQYRASFKQWEDGWQTFWKERDRLTAEWVTARDAGEKIDFEVISKQIDELYDEAVALENRTFGEMDQVWAQYVPESVRPMYLAGRQEIAGLRGQMREAVQAFRSNPLGDGRKYIDLTVEEQRTAQLSFWKERVRLIDAIHDGHEKHLASVLGRDPQAVASYSNIVKKNETLNALRQQWQVLWDDGTFGTARASGELRVGDSVQVAGERGQLLAALDPTRAGEARWRVRLADGRTVVRRGPGIQFIGGEDARTTMTALDSYLARARSMVQEGKATLEFASVPPDAEIAQAAEEIGQQVGLSAQEVLKDAIQAPGDGQISFRIAQNGDWYAAGIHLRQFSGEWLEGKSEFYWKIVELGEDEIFRGRHLGAESGRQLLVEALKRGKTQVRTTWTTKAGGKLVGFMEQRGWIKRIGTVGEGEALYEIVADNVNKSFSVASLPGARQLIPEPMPQMQGLYDLWMQRGTDALDAMGESVIAEGGRKTPKWTLDARGQGLLLDYLDEAKAGLSSDRLQAMKFGEYKRDAALLNYTRRLNYNNWLGTLAPYEFWTTTSIRKWALHSIDRPFVLANTLRLQHFLNTAYKPEPGRPQRLEGTVRISLPFLPKLFGQWLGPSVFVDPLGSALPFKQWQYGLGQYRRELASEESRAERALEEMLTTGRITQEQSDEAKASHSGNVWEQALWAVRKDDEEGRMNWMDVAQTITAPHAPLVWAYQLARGTPENIGPFLPMTRTLKGLTALLGIGPAGGVNVEGAIRRSMGLPAFDRWEDYRVGRMLSNMVADGDAVAADTKQAMLSQEGPLWEEAKRRAGIESGVRALGGFLGIPLQAYPPGEEHLRDLKDEYARAWDRYNAGETKALQEFEDKHPGYEVRQLALLQDPEKQMQRFLIDEIWDRWNGLPTQHRMEVADQLGTVFTEAFLDKETRDYETLSTDMLQYWARVMGAEVPGKFEWKPDMAPLELTRPEDAAQLEAFYHTRQVNFRYREQVSPVQDVYFSLKPGTARRQYLAEHPILRAYWDYRRDFMLRNPHLVQYIEDDPEQEPKFGTITAAEEARAQAPTFHWIEWSHLLSLSLWRLVGDHLQNAEPFDAPVLEELEKVADGLGISPEELRADLQEAYNNR